jgi:hypothetical protein
MPRLILEKTEAMAGPDRRKKARKENLPGRVWEETEEK